MKKQVSFYAPPHLTVVEFKIERGYVASSWSGGSMAENAAQQIQMFVDAEMAAQSSNDGNGNLVGGYMDGFAVDNSNPIGGSGWEYENGGWF